jgi:hypothetical protein
MCATSKVNLDLQRDRKSRQHHVAIFALSSLKWLCATAPTSLPCCPWNAEAWLWMCVVQPQPTLAEHSEEKLVDIIWYKIRYVTLLAWERHGLYETEDVPGACIHGGWQRNITIWIHVFIWHVRSLSFVPWYLVMSAARFEFRKKLQKKFNVALASNCSGPFQLLCLVLRHFCDNGAVSVHAMLGTFTCRR